MDNNKTNNKIKIARLSILSNSILIIMKATVGIITGSVSIISEAIHSSMDLIASIVAYLSVRISDKPADKEHPYGYGKFENISGVIEAILIFIAAILITIESIKKLTHPTEASGFIVIGFIVMFISAIVNFIVSKKIYKVAKEEDSIALEADALHLKTDVYTAIGVGVGLLLMWITKINILDPIAAILVAIFILKEAFVLLKSAFEPLVDIKLSDKEIEIIEKTISCYKLGYLDFHRLRTRKAGSMKYIDLHLVVPENMRIKIAHEMCDKIEIALNESLKNTEVMIHLETCEKDCIKCEYAEKEKCKQDELEISEGKI